MQNISSARGKKSPFQKPGGFRQQKHQRAWEPWDTSFYTSDVLMKSSARKESFRSVSGAPRSCLLSSSVHPYHDGRLFRRKGEVCKTSLFNSALCSQLWFSRGVWEVGQQWALLTLGVRCYHPFNLQALTGMGRDGNGLSGDWGKERANYPSSLLPLENVSPVSFDRLIFQEKQEICTGIWNAPFKIVVSNV